VKIMRCDFSAANNERSATAVPVRADPVNTSTRAATSSVLTSRSDAYPWAHSATMGTTMRR
jgi:hypothetical protein